MTISKKNKKKTKQKKNNKKTNAQLYTYCICNMFSFVWLVLICYAFPKYSSFII